MALELDIYGVRSRPPESSKQAVIVDEVTRAVELSVPFYSRADGARLEAAPADERGVSAKAAQHAVGPGRDGRSFPMTIFRRKSLCLSSPRTILSP